VAKLDFRHFACKSYLTFNIFDQSSICIFGSFSFYDFLTFSKLSVFEKHIINIFFQIFLKGGGYLGVVRKSERGPPFLCFFAFL
jgi:hypothetical protein